MKASLKNDSTILQTIICSVFISYITYGKLDYLTKKLKMQNMVLRPRGINTVKMSIRRGFSGLIPADSQIEN